MILYILQCLFDVTVVLISKVSVYKNSAKPPCYDFALFFSNAILRDSEQLYSGFLILNHMKADCELKTYYSKTFA